MNCALWARCGVVFWRPKNTIDWLFELYPELGFESVYPSIYVFHFINMIHSRITAFSELFYPVKFLNKPEFSVSFPITWFILEIALPFFLFLLLNSLGFGNRKFRIADVFEYFIEVVF